MDLWTSSLVQDIRRWEQKSTKAKEKKVEIRRFRNERSLSYNILRVFFAAFYLINLIKLEVVFIHEENIFFSSIC